MSKTQKLSGLDLDRCHRLAYKSKHDIPNNFSRFKSNVGVFFERLFYLFKHGKVVSEKDLASFIIKTVEDSKLSQNSNSINLEKIRNVFNEVIRKVNAKEKAQLIAKFNMALPQSSKSPPPGSLSISSDDASKPPTGNEDQAGNQADPLASADNANKPPTGNEDQTSNQADPLASADNASKPSTGNEDQAGNQTDLLASADDANKLSTDNEGQTDNQAGDSTDEKPNEDLKESPLLPRLDPTPKNFETYKLLRQKYLKEKNKNSKEIFKEFINQFSSVEAKEFVNQHPDSLVYFKHFGSLATKDELKFPKNVNLRKFSNLVSSKSLLQKASEDLQRGKYKILMKNYQQSKSNNDAHLLYKHFSELDDSQKVAIKEIRKLFVQNPPKEFGPLEWETIFFGCDDQKISKWLLTNNFNDIQLNALFKNVDDVEETFRDKVPNDHLEHNLNEYKKQNPERAERIILTLFPPRDKGKDKVRNEPVQDSVATSFAKTEVFKELAKNLDLALSFSSKDISFGSQDFADLSADSFNYEQIVGLINTIRMNLSDTDGETATLPIELKEQLNRLSNFLMNELKHNPEIKDSHKELDESNEMKFNKYEELKDIVQALLAYGLESESEWNIISSSEDDKITSYTPLTQDVLLKVNQVKASKYEKLLTTVKNSLIELGTFAREITGENDQLVFQRLRTIENSIDKVMQDSKVDYSDEHLNSLRVTFQVEFLLQIREAIVTCEASSLVSEKLKNFVYQVAYHLYTDNDMQQEMNNLLKLLGVRKEKEKEKDFSPENLVKNLKEAFNTLKRADPVLTTATLNRVARSAIDRFGIGFSPIGAGNPPQIMQQINFWGKEVRILGLGSPTIQPLRIPYFQTPTAIIDPIFRGYLHYLKIIGKKHLYVSNQNALQAKLWNDSENVRNDQIMQLQDEDDFAETFYAITCAKDSHFYEGLWFNSEKKEWSREACPSDSYLEDLQAQFFQLSKEVSGCFLSPKILKEIPNLKKISREFIQFIHENIFDRKEAYDSKDRKFFTELHYNMLTSIIAHKLGIDFMNFTCKDGIDRGMGSLAWFIFMWMTVNKTTDSKTEQNLEEILFTRAYWVRKRPIMDSRFNLFILIAERLNSLDQKHIENLRDKFQSLLK